MSEIELQDAILRHSLQLLRLSAGEQAEVDALMRELERELKMLLESRTISEATKTELKALIAEARTVIDARYAIAAQSVDTHALSLIVADHTVQTMAALGGLKANLPSAEVLASLTKDVLIDGAPSSAWWAKQAEDTAFKFAAQVRQGVINGETNESIVARIGGRAGSPGIMDVAKRNARALVHSSVMSAANDARLATFRKNSRILAGVRKLTALDGHVCVRCAAYGDQVDGWDLDGNPRGTTSLPLPPNQLHWNDRCVWSPIPKTFRDIGLDIDEPKDGGMRASSQGPVSGNTTFAAWFARRTRAQQDEQFGRTRAQLFRDGKITVRDLVNGFGRELTLEELTN